MNSDVGWRWLIQKPLKGEECMAKALENGREEHIEGRWTVISALGQQVMGELHLVGPQAPCSGENHAVE